jgi:hypothetical protein
LRPAPRLQLERSRPGPRRPEQQAFIAAAPLVRAARCSMSRMVIARLAWLGAFGTLAFAVGAATPAPGTQPHPPIERASPDHARPARPARIDPAAGTPARGTLVIVLTATGRPL